MPKIVQISVNPAGGVPKHRVESARLGFERVEGDKQRNLKYHGGPERAVCLYSLEVIKNLQREGHPIAPGTIGENLTISGLNWSEIVPGVRLQVGESEIEITSYVVPCWNIRGSFIGEKFGRISQKTHPGEGRLYARVLKKGLVREGDEVHIVEI